MIRRLRDFEIWIVGREKKGGKKKRGGEDFFFFLATFEKKYGEKNSFCCFHLVLFYFVVR